MKKDAAKKSMYVTKAADNINADAAAMKGESIMSVVNFNGCGYPHGCNGRCNDGCSYGCEPFIAEPYSGRCGCPVKPWYEKAAYGNFTYAPATETAITGIIPLSITSTSTKGMELIDGTIRIKYPGVYNIKFGVIATLATGATSAVSLSVNGNIITSTITPIISGTQVTSTAILVLREGDTVGINVNGEATLAAGTSANLNIVRIDN